MRGIALFHADDIYVFELKPFGRVYRHHGDAVVVFGFFVVGVGEQGDLLHPFGDAFGLLSCGGGFVGGLFQGVDKLLYVIERRLGLGGAFQLVGALLCRWLWPSAAHHFVGSGVRGGLLQVAYELDEFDYLVESARFDPQLVGTRHMSNVCHMLAFFLSGACGYAFHSSGAYAACRYVDYAPYRFVVVGVDDEGVRRRVCP